jgi:hypothetical protein
MSRALQSFRMSYRVTMNGIFAHNSNHGHATKQQKNGTGIVSLGLSNRSHLPTLTWPDDRVDLPNAATTVFRGKPTGRTAPSDSHESTIPVDFRGQLRQGCDALMPIHHSAKGSH